MPDVYANVTEIDPAVADRLGQLMELRASEAQQRAMRESYLADLALPAGARVLEVGCGTGAVVRAIARRPEVGEAVGVDPLPLFLAKARVLAEGIDNLSFREGDARALPFEDASFDAVVCHTLLCHVPGPEQALAEARRVLRPGGWLAIFDGDYAVLTVAVDQHDPLQACVEVAGDNLIHDRWLMRRLPTLVREAGFEILVTRSYSYAPREEPAYMLALIDRGADELAAAGKIGAALAAALKAEARRRVDEGRFYGQIAYRSLVARRSA